MKGSQWITGLDFSYGLTVGRFDCEWLLATIPGKVKRGGAEKDAVITDT